MNHKRGVFRKSKEEKERLNKESLERRKIRKEKQKCVLEKLQNQLNEEITKIDKKNAI